MRDNPVHHYYANTLLPNPQKIEAADLLLGTLLLVRQLEGQNISYFANKWRVNNGRLYTNCERARGEAQRRLLGLPRDLLQEAGRALPVSEMRANFRKYAPILEAQEADLCAELDDRRTELLIRGMFKDDCNAVFVRQRPKTLPRTPAARRRGPGRPPGSKNRPKKPLNATDGWVMPDGRPLDLGNEGTKS